MHTKRNKRLSIFSLFTGYLFLFIFVLLIIFQDSPEDIVLSESASDSISSPLITPEDNKTSPPLFIHSGRVIKPTISSPVLSSEFYETSSAASTFVDTLLLTCWAIALGMGYIMIMIGASLTIEWISKAIMKF